MDLSRSKIKYLLIIHRLSRETGKARSVDIAIHLGVARPSVHRMLTTMAEAGLVHMEPRSAVSLTQQGREAAEGYDRQYELVYPFLSEELGLSTYDAEQSAVAALSSLPRVCIEALCARAAGNEKASD
ncbi:MAG: metal-dependent transcriptional regulator [Clostridia bacterium]|nr:metal-dependent transcriptional regulator [Clostridia bacterium]